MVQKSGDHQLSFGSLSHYLRRDLALSQVRVRSSERRLSCNVRFHSDAFAGNSAALHQSLHHREGQREFAP